MLTIEGLDTRQVRLPSHVLPIDLAEISYKERVFVTGLAGIKIDTIDSVLQSSPNQFLGIVLAIVSNFVGTLGILEIGDKIVINRWCYKGGGDHGR